MNAPPLIMCLTRIPLLQAAGADNLAELAGASCKTMLPPGTVVAREGEPAEALVMVCSGWVKLTAGGAENTVVDVIGAGQFFGEAAIIPGQRLAFTATTVDHAALLSIPGERLRSALLNRPEMLRQMLAHLSGQIRGLLSQLADLKLKSTAQRLGLFLLINAPQRSGSVVFALPYPKKLLAERLGMKPESLSRSFARLRAIGVEVDHLGEKVEIASLEDLTAFCELRANTAAAA